MIKSSLTLFLFLIIASCKNTPGSLQEFNDFVANPDNGYSIEKEVNGIQVKAMYRPTNLMVMQELEHASKNKSVNKDSLFKKYNSAFYFLLSYQKDNNEILSTVPNSREEFNRIQDNLTFRMNDLVLLTCGKDTLTMLDFVSPRTYGMSKTTNVLMAFKKDPTKLRSHTLELNIQDIGIGIGDLTYRYPISLIEDK